MTVYRGPHGLHLLLGALGEPTRRRAYEVVRRAKRPVTRVEVAGDLGIGLRLAAFHLDKLVDEGLLEAHYARAPGRRGGPGAGRPAKQYVANPTRFDVTVPPRRYDIAARIMLAAITENGLSEVLSGARGYGETVAQQHGGARLDDLLIELGYEPQLGADGAIELTNCPFHELVEQARQPTCAMNHAFLDGVTSITDPTRGAVLDPQPGYCCVRLRTAATQMQSPPGTESTDTDDRTDEVRHARQRRRPWH
jgi:predicted ArsR family transcriptional regulator